MLALVLGSIVGFVLGLLGGGGSVLAIPALTYALGLEAKTAVATSLVVVGAASAMAVIAHARRGHVQVGVALSFGLLGAASAGGGAWLARWIPGAAQLLLFAAIMVVAGARMIRRGAASEGDDAPTASTPTRAQLWRRVPAAALGTGLLTGVVGVGGGFLIVPALVMVLGLPMRQAIGTSLAVIVLNAAGGFAGYAAYVELDPGTTFPFVLGAALASLAGSGLGQRVAPQRLQVAFGALVLAVAVVMIAKEGVSLLRPVHGQEETHVVRHGR